jgi:hypothetical protein
MEAGFKADLVRLTARGCYLVACFGVVDGGLGYKGREERARLLVHRWDLTMCYGVARLFAAFWSCSWLGDGAKTKLQAGRGVAPCMRSAPPARLKRGRE